MEFFDGFEYDPDILGLSVYRYLLVFLANFLNSYFFPNPFLQYLKLFFKLNNKVRIFFFYFIPFYFIFLLNLVIIILITICFI
jgi:hypothetical protein